MRFGALCRKTFRVRIMLDFPSTSRNREDIGRVLEQALDAKATLRVLELASGSGQHAAYFASRFPNWTIQPTDLQPEHCDSIEAYRQKADRPNLVQSLVLDVSSQKWPLDGEFDALWAINLIHIAPWEVTLGLFSGAEDFLAADGWLYLYGAFRRSGRHTALSNERFDQSLRSQNPLWGVRCLDEVTDVALESGLKLERVVEMPSNNLSVFFKRKL